MLELIMLEPLINSSGRSALLVFYTIQFELLYRLYYKCVYPAEGAADSWKFRNPFPRLLTMLSVKFLT